MMVRNGQRPVIDAPLSIAAMPDNYPKRRSDGEGVGVRNEMPIDKPYLLDLPPEWAGERVVLRRWRDEDARPLYDAIMASKEHLSRWMPWAQQYRSIDDAYQFIRGQSGHWSFQKHI